MPDEDNNFGGSLMLDFIKYRRHLQPKNMYQWHEESQDYSFLYSCRTVEKCLLTHSSAEFLFIHLLINLLGLFT